MPGLDGIRAIAVLAVIASHLGYGWAAGGFLGVDLFFVLSGYLITGLLLRERESTGNISLSSFYGRRARRLFPALGLFLLVFVLITWRTAAPVDLIRLRGDGLATLFYGANWHFIATGQSYGAQIAAPSPLMHMWSLAIEEQFYLLWPALLLVLWPLTRGRAGRLFAAVTGLAAASAVAMAVLYTPHGDPSRVYYGTDTRAFELMIGAALAVLVMRWPIDAWTRRTRRLVGVAAIAAVGVVGTMLVTVRWGTSPWLYRGGMVGFAVAAAIVVAGAHRGPVAWVLSLRPLQWIGKVSYGLYLWHWPVIVWMTPRRIGISGWHLDAARVGVALAATTVSYYVIERPIRTRRFRLPVPAVTGLSVAAALTAMILVSTSGGVALAVEGMHVGQAPKIPIRQAAPLSSSAPVRSPATPASAAPTTAQVPPTSPSPTAAQAPSTAPTAPPSTAPAVPPVVSVVGDSIAFTLVYKSGDVPGIRVGGAPVIGCGFGVNPGGQRELGSSTTCTKAVPEALASLESQRPDIVLIQTGEWEERSGRRPGAIRASWDESLQRVRAAAPQARVVVAPEGCLGDIAESPYDTASIAELLRSWADSHGLPVLNTDVWLCESAHRDDQSLRPDGQHFGNSAELWQWLAPQLLQLDVARH